MCDLWLSSERMTICVSIDAAGIIVSAPAIVKRFKGQHIDRLRSWMSKQGGLREAPLRPPVLYGGRAELAIPNSRLMSRPAGPQLKGGLIDENVEAG